MANRLVHGSRDSVGTVVVRSHISRLAGTEMGVNRDEVGYGGDMDNLHRVVG
jgi:hypothetical protein